MNTINTNFTPQTTYTTGANQAAPTDAANGVTVQAPGSNQPYRFVDGEPPKDANLVSAATYTAGLATPVVDQREFASKSGEVDFSNITTTTGAVNVQAQIMALQDILMKMMLVLRNDSLKGREDELQTMIKQKNLAIDKGLEEAYKQLVSGILTGVGQIMAGTMSMVGGFKGEGLNNGNVAQGKFSGAGTALNGIFTIAAASMTYQAAIDKAAQERNNLAADVANARMQQFNELASAFGDKFKAFMEAQLQTQRDLTQATNRVFA